MTTFAYDEQLASIPAAVADVLGRDGIPSLDPGRPIVFTGVGTSLHAASVAADWVAQLASGRIRALAVDAHELGAGQTPLTARDQVVVISHRGYKRYPNAALERARKLGCPTVAVVGLEAPEQEADWTMRTCASERAGTFSVSYEAALAALARIVCSAFPLEGGAFADSLSSLPDALAATLELRPEPSLVEQVSACTAILISGFGPDLATAREAALKIKEGAWLWTEATSPELALHGTPAGYTQEMGAVVLEPATDDGGRSALLVEVLRELGLRSLVTCGPDGSGAPLRFATPPHPFLRPFLAILPFHLLTAELARLRGTDPDSLHGGRDPWTRVMTGIPL
ncbi:MAG: SIS domain-containing protein [Actinobacteria bacterium]|nr:SIS domain-containing protein [Actinomycetota bacterium]